MYSNISSIGASIGWMNASANNVANINTKQFTPTNTVISEGSNLSPPNGLSVNAMNTQNEMAKTLLDIKF